MGHEIVVALCAGGAAFDFPGEPFGDDVLVVAVFDAEFLETVPALTGYVIVDVEFQADFYDVRICGEGIA